MRRSFAGVPRWTRWSGSFTQRAPNARFTRGPFLFKVAGGLSANRPELIQYTFVRKRKDLIRLYQTSNMYKLHVQVCANRHKKKERRERAERGTAESKNTLFCAFLSKDVNNSTWRGGGNWKRVVARERLPGFCKSMKSPISTAIPKASRDTWPQHRTWSPLWLAVNTYTQTHTHTHTHTPRCPLSLFFSLSLSDGHHE